MTKQKKLTERLLLKPKDFTWNELEKVLASFGYKQISGGKTGGSRVRFIHPDYPPVILHKPHPKRILKRYQLEGIIDLLKQEKLL
ncbi:MAG: hexulose-6-phosphate synthase [Gammaproteobacteria bacterium]|jgi:predicted RNA binding protein YcfA (HicA-like mRNA interferase family)|nr:hexulose-6-phosphate synthase [Gammaproteobacteria bacterium]